MASEMPVLPLEGSRIVRPGYRSPRSSAASIMASATRSLTEPVGFSDSSLASSRTPGRGERRVSSTSGVSPTVARRPVCVVWCSVQLTPGLYPSGHRRHHDDRGALAQRRVEAGAEANVLLVHEDVHEPVEVAPVVHDLGMRGRVLVEQVVEGG